MSAYVKLDASERKSAAFDSALALLKERALRDEYSLVREAAVESLFRLSPTFARPVLDQVAKEDPERKVADRASALLRGSADRRTESSGARLSP
jgi:hypothetical protein